MISRGCDNFCKRKDCRSISTRGQQISPAFTTTVTDSWQLNYDGQPANPKQRDFSGTEPRHVQAQAHGEAGERR